LQNGYTLIDCAECYGNEKEVGEVLKDVVGTGAGENSVISRDKLFVTSKVWNTNHKPEHVRQACLNSLKNLGLDYLDLYLVHWPLAWGHTGVDLKPARPTDEEGKAVMARVPLMDTWRAMEALVDDGLVSTVVHLHTLSCPPPLSSQVKSIGVSNYSVLLLNDLLSYARIPPVVNQVELHPYLQQHGLHSFCRANQIVLTAYSPLGRPGQQKGGPLLLGDPVVVRIAAQTGTTPAQVVLRWNVQRGVVVIPKSATEKRIRQNLRGTVAMVLSDEAMAELNTIDLRHHFCSYPWAYGGCGLYDDSLPNC
jgi:diketogulonate reductase-like aldo/keto reductase